ncbi:hypothetical protein HBI23_141310 [Parastagonospora nodorum]|nr:hypothetical protein HBI79_126640 [Parastagonospora nodorum]KAH5095824.1 hypothetical protein HBH72_146270 [Parastagonospora nodorum]KAH5247609.1 hypothetical protein HBI71_175280 [Parastagonospora nodorum]KAH5415539.1 hypothetical protein HBI47_147810 [Parastagonospora nodorum]KAH5657832.1 hypothetical protein HBI23_141310 [Parastagonospora nodorum]
MVETGGCRVGPTANDTGDIEYVMQGTKCFIMTMPLFMSHVQVICHTTCSVINIRPFPGRALASSHPLVLRLPNYSNMHPKTPVQCSCR